MPYVIVCHFMSYYDTWHMTCPQQNIALWVSKGPSQCPGLIFLAIFVTNFLFIFVLQISFNFCNWKIFEENFFQFLLWKLFQFLAWKFFSIFAMKISFNFWLNIFFHFSGKTTFNFAGITISKIFVGENFLQFLGKITSAFFYDYKEIFYLEETGDLLSKYKFNATIKW